jgi:AcrR family transcriptional regulator
VRTHGGKPALEVGPPGTGLRHERKLRTRAALMRSALELLADRSFGSLSLREVARGAGVVPTAFYRHFESTEELGLALIDESFRTLRAMLREARSEPVPEHVIRRSVEILVSHVHEHRLHFRFIVRERHSGVAALRQAIRAEIRLFTSELATDLRRFPQLGDWSTDDLQMMAGLIVNTMVSTAEAIVDAPIDNPEVEAEIVGDAERQLTLIAVGAAGWRTSPGPGNRAAS